MSYWPLSVKKQANTHKHTHTHTHLRTLLQVKLTMTKKVPPLINGLWASAASQPYGPGTFQSLPSPSLSGKMSYTGLNHSEKHGMCGFWPDGQWGLKSQLHHFLPLWFRTFVEASTSSSVKGAHEHPLQGCSEEERVCVKHGAQCPAQGRGQ